MQRWLAGGLIVLMAAIGHAQSATLDTAHWIQAPWSTARDGAEADGSRPMPLFRREFTTRYNAGQATLRIAGLGQFAVTLDGRPLTAPGLHQSWTDYRKTVAFETLTFPLPAGRHVLVVSLGNGMYNVQRSTMPNGKSRYTKFEGSFGPPRLIAALTVPQPPGQPHAQPFTLATDATWQARRGPVTFSSTYGGEDFDARLLDDTGWTPVKLVDGPGGQLIPDPAPEVREIRTLPAIHTTTLPGGRVLFDFGQNAAAWPRIRVHGPAGAVLRLTPGELLKPDGSVSQTSSADPQFWTYTLRGDRHDELWQPAFSYYGYRYLEAQWLTPAPGTLRSAESLVLSSGSPVTGTFTSSSDLLNRIHALVVAAMHSNQVSIFTDCPHREKLGWLEETHLVASAMLFNSDLRGLYRATEANITDAQAPDGNVPTIVPQYTKFGPKYAIYDDSPEWGSAAILGPWAAFRIFGDTAELARDYPTMQRYLDHLHSRATPDGIVAYGLGDWYDIGPGNPGFEKNTTLGVTGTLMLFEDAAAMTRIAELLGHPQDAARYQALAAATADAYNRRFWDPAKAVYDTGSQTASAMPLALGLVPADRRQVVLDHLLADIHAHKDHITTGEVGYPYLQRVLMAAGRDDVLLAMSLRTDPPSYGSQLAAGATALTEAWDANPHSSQDHLMLGAIEEWFYRGLGGIDLDLSRPDPTRRLTLRPALVAGLDHVACTYASTLGPIESRWLRAPRGHTYDVVTPIAATVILPASAQTKDASPITSADGLITFQVQPGHHHFTIP